MIYPDNLFIMGQDGGGGGGGGRGTLRQTWAAINLLEALGFLVSFKKSVVKPSQVIKYLRFLIDSIRKEMRLPAKKLNQIKKEARQLLIGSGSGVDQNFGQFISKLSAAILAIHLVPA